MPRPLFSKAAHLLSPHSLQHQSFWYIRNSSEAMTTLPDSEMRQERNHVHFLICKNMWVNLYPAVLRHIWSCGVKHLGKTGVDPGVGEQDAEPLQIVTTALSSVDQLPAFGLSTVLMRNSRTRAPEFKAQLCHFGTVCLQVNYAMFLSLSFFIYNP